MTDKEAFQFIADYLHYHMCQAIEAEPHETLSSATLTTLECVGCSAKGVRRWPGWKKEFIHDADCRWMAWLAKMRKLGIELRLNE